MKMEENMDLIQVWLRPAIMLQKPVTVCAQPPTFLKTVPRDPAIPDDVPLLLLETESSDPPTKAVAPGSWTGIGAR